MFNEDIKRSYIVDLINEFGTLAFTEIIEREIHKSINNVKISVNRVKERASYVSCSTQYIFGNYKPVEQVILDRYITFGEFIKRYKELIEFRYPLISEVQDTYQELSSLVQFSVIPNQERQKILEYQKLIGKPVIGSLRIIGNEFCNLTVDKIKLYSELVSADISIDLISVVGIIEVYLLSVRYIAVKSQDITEIFNSSTLEKTEEPKIQSKLSLAGFI